VAVRPEKLRLAREFQGEATCNQIEGVVWELGYLGNHSIYRIKTSTGKIIVAMAQNDRRTASWSIDWNDKVQISWSEDAAILLPG
jgi:putrescine transport system ATP-binding protein